MDVYMYMKKKLLKVRVYLFLNYVIVISYIWQTLCDFKKGASYDLNVTYFVNIAHFFIG